MYTLKTPKKVISFVLNESLPFIKHRYKFEDIKIDSKLAYINPKYKY
jgi:hypothetical protein